MKFWLGQEQKFQSEVRCTLCACPSSRASTSGPRAQAEAHRKAALCLCLRHAPQDRMNAETEEEAHANMRFISCSPEQEDERRRADDDEEDGPDEAISPADGVRRSEERSECHRRNEAHCCDPVHASAQDENNCRGHAHAKTLDFARGGTLEEGLSEAQHERAPAEQSRRRAEVRGEDAEEEDRRVSHCPSPPGLMALRLQSQIGFKECYDHHGKDEDRE